MSSKDKSGGLRSFRTPQLKKCANKSQRTKNANSDCCHTIDNFNKRKYAETEHAFLNFIFR